MKMSVIIPTLNRAEDVRAALESLLIQTRCPFEILLIDQSTNDETARLADRMKGAALEQGIYLRYVRQSEKSLVKARNRGLLLAIGDVLSFLDDDVVLFNDYCSAVLRAFESDRRLAGAGGNVIVEREPRGPKWWARKALMRTLLLSGFDGRMTASGFGTPIFERKIVRRMAVELLPGCNMNFRREFIGEETFDEWFSGYSFREDVDFSYRISQKGKCVMLPEARLYHHYSASGRLDVDELTKMMIANYSYVFRKHKDFGLPSKLLFAYSLLGLLVLDGIEWAFNRDWERWRRVRAEFSSSIELLLGGAR